MASKEFDEAKRRAEQGLWRHIPNNSTYTQRQETIKGDAAGRKK